MIKKMCGTNNEKVYFQNYMPENVCFGCGVNNTEGLQIKSFWEDENTSVCIWNSQEKYHGWANLLNGGILATLIDCHCMGTAMAAAYRSEKRSLDSEPVYRYATGTLTVKYLKPTPNDKPIILKTKVGEIKGRKTSLTCEAFCDGIKTAEAEVIGIRVFDSSKDHDENPFI